MITPVEEPGLRADAARNRAAILAAARSVFAEHGTTASLDAVAKSAGVAKGTVFRHFATKTDLVLALFTTVTDSLRDAAVDARGGADPISALSGFMLTGAAILAEDPLFCETIGRATYDGGGAVPALAALRDVVADLVARARDTGAIRAEITADDVLLLLTGVQQATAPLEARAPDARRRYIDLIIDGMRVTDARALHGPSPTVV